MNIPGFTAEVSLAKTSGSYKLANFANTGGEQAVAPQRMKAHSVYCNCDSGGACICSDGSVFNNWTGA
jgi:hypothetical protein